MLETESLPRSPELFFVSIRSSSYRGSTVLTKEREIQNSKVNDVRNLFANCICLCRFSSDTKLPVLNENFTFFITTPPKHYYLFSLLFNLFVLRHSQGQIYFNNCNNNDNKGKDDDNGEKVRYKTTSEKTLYDQSCSTLD